MKVLREQKGFSAIEGLLILTIIAIIGGVGFFVYHSTNKASDTLNAADLSTNSPAVRKKATSAKESATNAKTTTKYFSITEWNVRAPYTGDDTYTYQMANDDNLATVISKRLADSNPDCKTFGAGQIGRALGTDDYAPGGGSGVTVAQQAAKEPANYKHIGNYYYSFKHDQAVCTTGDNPADQNAANTAVSQFIAKLEAVPAH